jgi:hypothetical protein
LAIGLPMPMIRPFATSSRVTSAQLVNVIASVGRAVQVQQPDGRRHAEN